MKNKLTKILLATVALMASWNTWGQYAIETSTIDGGGGTCGASSFGLSGTIGQPDASEPMTAGDYAIVGGFWAEEFIDAPLPFLSITRSGPNVIISWPATFTGSRLEATSDLKVGAVWTPVSQPVAQVGNEYRVTVPMTQARQFFRLVL
jgi:hypothetical protein